MSVSPIFFEKVEDVRKLVKISDADLIACFVELLKEPALTQFKVNRAFYNSWDELKDSLKEI